MTAEQNGNNVEIGQFDPQPVVSIRGIVQIADLGEAMGDRLSALQGYLQQNGVEPAGPPFVRYHTFGETETDVETGIPVTERVAGEGRIAAGELPGGPAVTTWHHGSHDKLGEAYARISAAIQDHDREPSGPAWEVYHWIDPAQPLDPSTWDPSTWGTQLVQPVKE